VDIVTDQCYQASEFDRLLELPAGHEDLDHLSSCSTCQENLDLYKSFLAPAEGASSGDILDSHQRLLAFLNDESDQHPEPIPLPRRKFGTFSRVALAAAACLACMAILVNLDFLGQRGVPNYPSGVVRDLSEGSSQWQVSEKSTPGGFLLQWVAHPVADSYEVVVLDASLNQVDRFAVPSTGEFLLLSAQFSWLQNQPGPFFWSLVALNNGDEIARSSVRSLERGS